MTDDDKAAIAAAPDRMAAEWWCLLNAWEWPREGLGEPDPVPDRHNPNSRRGQIMRAIEARVGMRACLREWNRERMPDNAQFDAWWTSGGRSLFA